MKYIKISEEEFYSKYKPIKNPLDENARFYGCMYKNYDIGLGLVQKAHERKPLKIWTICDFDGDLIIESGFNFANSMGYLITSRSAPENTQIVVKTKRNRKLRSKANHNKPRVI